MRGNNKFGIENCPDSTDIYQTLALNQTLRGAGEKKKRRVFYPGTFTRKKSEYSTGATASVSTVPAASPKARMTASE